MIISTERIMDCEGAWSSLWKRLSDLVKHNQVVHMLEISALTLLYVSYTSEENLSLQYSSKYEKLFQFRHAIRDLPGRLIIKGFMDQERDLFSLGMCCCLLPRSIITSPNFHLCQFLHWYIRKWHVFLIFYDNN